MTIIGDSNWTDITLKVRVKAEQFRVCTRVVRYQYFGSVNNGPEGYCVIRAGKLIRLMASDILLRNITKDFSADWLSFQFTVRK